MEAKTLKMLSDMPAGLASADQALTAAYTQKARRKGDNYVM